jgi:hypothetical protein
MVRETYSPSEVRSSPVEVSMNETPMVELLLGIRINTPPCCEMTTSLPPMVEMSLKIDTGVPGVGSELGVVVLALVPVA